jgi:hypothetical protein
VLAQHPADQLERHAEIRRRDRDADRRTGERIEIAELADELPGGLPEPRP